MKIQLRSPANKVNNALRVINPWQLDYNPIRALALNASLRGSKFVDTTADNAAQPRPAAARTMDAASSGLA